MELTTIYAAIVGGLFLLLLLRHGMLILLSKSLPLRLLVSESLVKSRRLRLLILKFFCRLVIKRGSLLPSISRIDVLLQLCYWATTVACNVVGVSSPAEGGARAGTLAMVNLVPLFFGDRLAFIADLLALSRKTYAQVHKSVGVMTLFQLSAHIAIGAVYGKLDVQRSEGIFGLVAVTALATMSIIALPFPRKTFYEFFLQSHYALSAVVVLGLWHRFDTGFRQERIILVAAIGIYTLTSLARMTRLIYRNAVRRSQWSRAKLIKHNEALEVSIEIKRPWTVRPGQYVYLWAPGLSFGSFFEWHPFSIAWWTADVRGHAKTIALIIKPEHGFTNRLASYPTTGRELFVAIDGPYGGVVETSFYGTLVLFASGIGIAAQILVVKQALAQRRSGTSAVSRIVLVWQMEQESDEDWVANWLDEMLEEDREFKMFHTQLYVLRGFKNKDSKNGDRLHYGQRVQKVYGPADWKSIMAKEMQNRIGRMLVTVSAKPQVRDEIREVVSSIADVEYRELEFQPNSEGRLWTIAELGAQRAGSA